MQFWLGGTGSKAYIGCGALLVIFGLVLLSPLIDWLITGLGYLSIAAGLILAVIGIIYWFSGLRRRDF